MRMRVVLCVFLAIFACGMVLGQDEGVVVIKMTNFKFDPKVVQVQIAKIKTIRFVCEEGTHTATCDMKGRDGKKIFESGKLKKGESFEVDVRRLYMNLGAKGTKLEYYCVPHSDKMKGTIELK
jgi:plastocyanin